MTRERKAPAARRVARALVRRVASDINARLDATVDLPVTDAETEALYASLPTVALLTLRHAFTLDRERPSGAVHDVESMRAFCQSRIDIITRVLDSRPPSITCPVCQRTSYHPKDISERYCGACHRFHDDPVPESAP